MENEASMPCPYPGMVCAGPDCVWFDYDDCMCAFFIITESRAAQAPRPMGPL